jgi:Lrp/AsnC family transcriptional regulator for asnA, asnC and gidA
MALESIMSKDIIDIDQLDQDIIDILRQGHRTNGYLAKELGVVEGTIRSRIKRLKDLDVLVQRSQINPEVLEDKMIAMIAIKVNQPKLLNEKAEEVSKLEGVISASIVSGHYDIMAEVMMDSNRGFVRFLTEVLPLVDGILATESFVVLRSFGKYV